jgi:predicted enzyme related to lactoylglutathione lyase
MTDTTGMVPPKPLLDLIIIDCPNALELAQFYSAVLGWALEDGADKDWANLEPPGGGLSPDNPDGRPTLAFQGIADFVRPTWPGGEHPQQFHLDLWAGDIDHHEPAVLAAGASVHEHQPSKDGGFRVYTDPAGHPFCLLGIPTS